MTRFLQLYEQHFFELAGDLTVEVEFLLSDEQEDGLLARPHAEGARVVYARTRAEFGMIQGND